MKTSGRTARSAEHHVSQNPMVAPQPSPPEAHAWSRRKPSTPSATLPSPFGSSQCAAHAVTVFTAPGLVRSQWMKPTEDAFHVV